MYKLSVGHAKIFYDFFASLAGFRQNSAEFFAKPAGNRLPKFQKNRPNYRQIRPIIRLIRPNFVFLKISSQLQFDGIFLIFPDFFFKFYKMGRIHHGTNFPLAPNFVTLVRLRTKLQYELNWIGRDGMGIDALVGAQESLLVSFDKGRRR
jgi:hypothetical protein